MWESNLVHTVLLHSKCASVAVGGLGCQRLLFLLHMLVLLRHLLPQLCHTAARGALEKTHTHVHQQTQCADIKELVFIAIGFNNTADCVG